jgi:hypothetical protein
MPKQAKREKEAKPTPREKQPKPAKRPLRIRIVGTQLPGRACGPYREIFVGLQVGQEVEQLVEADVPRAVWEADATLDAAGVVGGKAIHGGRGERFLYLSWGGKEGATGKMAMFRRAKIQLDVVGAALLAEAAADPGRVLEAELGLTDAKGLPRCASVRPPLVSWRVSSR